MLQRFVDSRSLGSTEWSNREEGDTEVTVGLGHMIPLSYIKVGEGLEPQLNDENLTRGPEEASNGTWLAEPPP